MHHPALRPDLCKLSGVLDTIDEIPANAPLVLVKVRTAAMITDHG
jgi:hypothetical protein